MKKERGITLVSLVVTIIILIILAGVSINLILGNNGVIEKAKGAKEINSEQSAKEKLELEIGNISIDKFSIETYNEEYFDNYMQQKGFIVNGNIVLVNGWQFQVDKSVPKIVEGLGKGEEIQQIAVTTDVTYAADYTKAILTLYE